MNIKTERTGQVGEELDGKECKQPFQSRRCVLPENVGVSGTQRDKSNETSILRKYFFNCPSARMSLWL